MLQEDAPDLHVLLRVAEGALQVSQEPLGYAHHLRGGRGTAKAGRREAGSRWACGEDDVAGAMVMITMTPMMMQQHASDSGDRMAAAMTVMGITKVTKCMTALALLRGARASDLPERHCRGAAAGGGRRPRPSWTTRWSR